MELLRHDGVDGAEPRSEPADLAGNDGDDLVGAAVELAERLLAEAGRLESRAQRRRQARLGALVEDRDAKRFAFLLTDRVLRPADRAVGARQLAKLVAKRGAPRAFPLLDRLGLRLAAAAAPKAPGLVMPLVVARLRRESDPVILDARPDRLARHLARRRRQGISGNVNVLGEAILGDAEADRRRAAMLAQLADPAVDYVSVKLSAIAANLSVVAFDATVERLAERLAPLYRAAAVTTPPKFVNLDMEEYRDLWLTVGVFRALLERPEFERLPAGIVLQAYLPDSFTALVELTEWAQARVAAGGAPVKVRIVKGANLAMEAVEAEQHGWTPAPFATKAEVDANYKKMLDWALTPERAAAVRIGAASHNLYDLAWALLLAEARGVSERVDAEMLEGMAPGQSLAVARRARRLLAYTPIADRADFASAVAYLTRRLDENTAPENFLAALHRLAADPAALAEQRQRFEAAVRDRLTLSAEPRRRQDRRAASPPTPSGELGPFVNEPDTDFTLPANRAWLAAELAAPRDAALPDELTTLADIDEAVARARTAAARWRAAPAGAR
ncbi:MAG: proline dehydrogenase family protein, partial [Acidimicrobiales bacterium]